MPYDPISGFPMSGKTWFEISEENYFKILETAQKAYPEEIEQILKPKTTIIAIEPLTKRDILGIVSIFELSNDIPNYQTSKLNTLRNNFKKLVELQVNEDLNNYLVSENLMDRALISKKVTTKTSKVKHNKTKKLFNFILSKYLDVELEEPKKEMPEEDQIFEGEGNATKTKFRRKIREQFKIYKTVRKGK